MARGHAKRNRILCRDREWSFTGIRTRLRRRLPDHRDAGMGHHTRRDSRQSDSGVIDWGARENRDAQQICRHVQVALNIMAKRNGVRRMFVTTVLPNVYKYMI